MVPPCCTFTCSILINCDFDGVDDLSEWSQMEYCVTQNSFRLKSNVFLRYCLVYLNKIEHIFEQQVG